MICKLLAATIKQPIMKETRDSNQIHENTFHPMDSKSHRHFSYTDSRNPFLRIERYSEGISSPKSFRRMSDGNHWILNVIEKLITGALKILILFITLMLKKQLPTYDKIYNSISAYIIYFDTL